MNNFVYHENKTSWGIVWHIITSDGKGHVAASIEDEEENDTIFIYGLSVIPEVRNQGIGKQLVKLVEQIGIDRGLHRVRLNVEVEQKELCKYYENLGYEYWDEDKTYFYMIKYINK